MERCNSIKLECPHCKDLNRSKVKDVTCSRGSNNIIRTRICTKCKKSYFTSEKIVDGRKDTKDSLRKSFKVLEANLSLLKNKVMKD